MSATKPIALVAALEIVVVDEIMEVALDLVIGVVIGLSAGDSETFFDQCSDSAGLEGPTHVMEGVPMVARDFAGFGDVAEFLWEVQQRKLSSCTLKKCGHLGMSWLVGGVAITYLTGDPGGRTSWPEKALKCGTVG